MHVHGGQVRKRQRVQIGPKSQMAERLKAYQRKQTRIVKVLIIGERDSKCSWKKGRRGSLRSHDLLAYCSAWMHSQNPKVCFNIFISVCELSLIISEYVCSHSPGRTKIWKIQEHDLRLQIVWDFFQQLFYVPCTGLARWQGVHCRALHCPGDSCTSCNLLTQYWSRNI